VFFVQRAYLQAAKRTRELVVGTVVANVVNLFGDILFVFGGAGLPEWTGPLRQVPAMRERNGILTSSYEVALSALVIASETRGQPSVSTLSWR
jgi:MATE family multidrug resistance protein